jgi:microcystin-dependent protein
MPRREIVGGAATAALIGGISNSDLSMTVTPFTGWPTGTFNFVACIDRESETTPMEKVLCTARASGVITIGQRGYDGTSAVAHNSDAIVEHVISAETLSDVNAHAFDTTRDDHTQYNTPARHAATVHTGAMIDLAGIAGLGLDVSANTLVVDPEEFASLMAGAGLAANGDALDIGEGHGIDVAADSIAVDESELDIALMGGTNPAILASLLTTRGDLIRRGASAPQRVALGSSGQVLTSDGTDAVWATPATPASGGDFGGNIIMGSWTAAPTGFSLFNATVTSAQSLYPETWANTPAGWHSGSSLVLPDVRGRLPINLKSTDTDFDAIGDTGGAKTHTLSVAELPAHHHSISRDQAAPGGTTESKPVDPGTGDTSSVDTGDTGSGTPFNIMNPFFVVNFAIRLK